MSEIKVGDKVLTQEMFNKQYQHYQELLLQEDTAEFWEEQFRMADAERKHLKDCLIHVSERLSETQNWLKSAINNSILSTTSKPTQSDGTD